jgi:Icc-related predicted phosphoesterase
LAKFLKRSYDLLIMLGDFTHLGPESQVEEILSRAEEIKIRTLAVPGNCDPKPVQQVLEKHGINLHSKSVEVNGLTFVGLGGSNTTPFNTPFELKEGEIEEELSALTCNLNDKWVLVTHVPAYGTCADLLPDGIHVGSKSVRKIIERKQPLVALCAHVHEARCIDKVGKTTVVNPGPISNGYAAEVTLDKGVKVELLEL